MVTNSRWGRSLSRCFGALLVCSASVLLSFASLSRLVKSLGAVCKSSKDCSFEQPRWRENNAAAPEKRTLSCLPLLARYRILERLACLESR